MSLDTYLTPREPDHDDAEWERAEDRLRERRGLDPEEHLDPWDVAEECDEMRADQRAADEDARYARWKDDYR